jgi:hypothetical protein
VTLIVACRYEDKVIYCHDFRVTRPNMQRDAVVKWMFFDDRLGLLVTGSVDLWEDAKARIDAVIDSIDLGNLMDVGGPFHEALIDAALQYPGPPQDSSGAIGFIVDTNRGVNLQFSVQMLTGYGARISDLSQSDVAIMGSGSRVPGIEDSIRRSFDRCRRIAGDDGFVIGHCIRNEILASFNRIGPASFAEYGVSPLMGLGLLEGAAFRIPGEVGRGLVVNGNRFLLTGYSFTSNNGRPAITDDVARTSVELSFVGQAPVIEGNRTLDPEHRTDI